MRKIRKGDIVGRKSYGKDIYFKVSHIIDNTNEKIAILNGLVERIEADSPLSDLEIISREEVRKRLRKLNITLKKRIFIAEEKRGGEKIISGKILHLDGDSCLDNKNSHWLKILNLKKKYLTTN